MSQAILSKNCNHFLLVRDLTPREIFTFLHVGKRCLNFVGGTKGRKGSSRERAGERYVGNVGKEKRERERTLLGAHPEQSARDNAMIIYSTDINFLRDPFV